MSSSTANATAGALGALLQLVWCPRCRGSLGLKVDETGKSRALHCTDCDTEFPVRHGIPRFVDRPDDPLAQRTQASFGYEWSHFDDWAPSGHTNFQDYFTGIDLSAMTGAVVLDAGCGMGRHARQLAPYVGLIVALDFSRAIDSAARTVATQPNVSCVQADLTQLPVRDEAFDFVYSMGVVHHLVRTEEVVHNLARKLRPGGRLRLYLYWKRSGWSGALLRLVSAVRQVTTRLPFPLLRSLCWVLSLFLYAVVILPYRGLRALGVDALERWPLYVYTKYPFQVLYNDQFDRFSAPLEKRYTADEAAVLLRGAGLRDVCVTPMFGWIVEGVRE